MSALLKFLVLINVLLFISGEINTIKGVSPSAFKIATTGGYYTLDVYFSKTIPRWQTTYLNYLDDKDVEQKAMCHTHDRGTFRSVFMVDSKSIQREGVVPFNFSENTNSEKQTFNVVFYKNDLEISPNEKYMLKSLSGYLSNLEIPLKYEIFKEEIFNLTVTNQKGEVQVLSSDDYDYDSTKKAIIIKKNLNQRDVETYVFDFYPIYNKTFSDPDKQRYTLHIVDFIPKHDHVIIRRTPTPDKVGMYIYVVPGDEAIITVNGGSKVCTFSPVENETYYYYLCEVENLDTIDVLHLKSKLNTKRDIYVIRYDPIMDQCILTDKLMKMEAINIELYISFGYSLTVSGMKQDIMKQVDEFSFATVSKFDLDKIVITIYPSKIALNKVWTSHYNKMIDELAKLIGISEHKFLYSYFYESSMKLEKDHLFIKEEDQKLNILFNSTRNLNILDKVNLMKDGKVIDPSSCTTAVENVDGMEKLRMICDFSSSLLAAENSDEGNYTIGFYTKCDKVLDTEIAVQILKRPVIISITRNFVDYDKLNKLGENENIPVIVEYDDDMEIHVNEGLKLSLYLVNDLTTSKSPLYTTKISSKGKKYVEIELKKEDQLIIGEFVIKSSYLNSRRNNYSTPKIKIDINNYKFLFSHHYMILKEGKTQNLMITALNFTKSETIKIYDTILVEYAQQTNTYNKYKYLVHKTGNFTFYFIDKDGYHIEIKDHFLYVVEEGLLDLVVDPAKCIYKIFHYDISSKYKDLVIKGYLKRDDTSSKKPLTCELTTEDTTKAYPYTYRCSFNISNQQGKTADLIGAKYHIYYYEGDDDDFVLYESSNQITMTDITFPEYIFRPNQTLILSGLSCELTNTFKGINDNNGNAILNFNKLTSAKVGDKISLTLSFKENTQTYETGFTYGDYNLFINGTEQSFGKTFISNALNTSYFTLDILNTEGNKIKITIENPGKDVYIKKIGSLNIIEVSESISSKRTYGLKYNETENNLIFERDMGSNPDLTIDSIERNPDSWETKNSYLIYQFKENNKYKNDFYQIYPKIRFFTDNSQQTTDINVKFRDSDTMKNFCYQNDQFDTECGFNQLKNCQIVSDTEVKCTATFEPNNHIGQLLTIENFSIEVNNKNTRKIFLVYYTIKNKCQTISGINNKNIEIDLSTHKSYNLGDINLYYNEKQLIKNGLKYSLGKEELKSNELQIYGNITDRPEEGTFYFDTLLNFAEIFNIIFDIRQVVLAEEEQKIQFYLRNNEDISKIGNIFIRDKNQKEYIGKLNSNNLNENQHEVTFNFDSKTEAPLKLFYIDHCGEVITTGIEIETGSLSFNRQHFVLNNLHNNLENKKQEIKISGIHNIIIIVHKDGQSTPYKTISETNDEYTYEFTETGNYSYTFKTATNSFEQKMKMKTFVVAELKDLLVEQEEFIKCKFIDNSQSSSFDNTEINLKTNANYINTLDKNKITLVYKSSANVTYDEASKSIVNDIIKFIYGDYSKTVNDKVNYGYLLENNDENNPLFVFRTEYTTISLTEEYKEMIYLDAEFIKFNMNCHIDKLESFVMKNKKNNKDTSFSCDTKKSQYSTDGKIYTCYLASDLPDNSQLETSTMYYIKDNNQYNISDEYYLSSSVIKGKFKYDIPSSISNAETLIPMTSENYFYMKNIEKVSYKVYNIGPLTNSISENNFAISRGNDLIKSLTLSFTPEKKYIYAVGKVCRVHCTYCKTADCADEEVKDNMAILISGLTVNWTRDKTFIALKDSNPQNYEATESQTNSKYNDIQVFAKDGNYNNEIYLIDKVYIYSVISDTQSSLYATMTSSSSNNILTSAGTITKTGKYIFKAQKKYTGEIVNINDIFIIVVNDLSELLAINLPDENSCILSINNKFYANLTIDSNYESYKDLIKQNLYLEIVDDSNNKIERLSLDKTTNKYNFPESTNNINLHGNKSLKFRFIYITEQIYSFYLAVRHRNLGFTTFYVKPDDPYDFYYADNILVHDLQCDLKDIKLKSETCGVSDLYCRWDKDILMSYCFTKCLFLKIFKENYSVYHNGVFSSYSEDVNIYSNINATETEFKPLFSEQSDSNYLKIRSPNFDLEKLTDIWITDNFYMSYYFDGEHDFSEFSTNYNNKILKIKWPQDFIDSYNPNYNYYIIALFRPDRDDDLLYSEESVNYPAGFPIETAIVSNKNVKINDLKCSYNSMLEVKENDEETCKFCYEEYPDEKPWYLEKECLKSCISKNAAILDRQFKQCSSKCDVYVKEVDEGYECVCPIGYIKIPEGQEKFIKKKCYPKESSILSQMFGNETWRYCYKEEEAIHHNYCHPTHTEKCEYNEEAKIPVCTCLPGYTGELCRNEEGSMSVSDDFTTLLKYVDEELGNSVDFENTGFIAALSNVLNDLVENATTVEAYVKENKESVKSLLTKLVATINAAADSHLDVDENIYDVLKGVLYFGTSDLSYGLRRLGDEKINENFLLNIHKIDKKINRDDGSVNPNYSILSDNFNMTTFTAYKKDYIKDNQFNSLLKSSQMTAVYEGKNLDVISKGDVNKLLKTKLQSRISKRSKGRNLDNIDESTANLINIGTVASNSDSTNDLFYITTINKKIYNILSENSTTSTNNNNEGIVVLFSYGKNYPNPALSNESYTMKISNLPGSGLSYKTAKDYEKKGYNIFDESSPIYEPCFISSDFEYDLTQKYRKTQIYPATTYYNDEDYCKYNTFDMNTFTYDFVCNGYDTQGDSAKLSFSLTTKEVDESTEYLIFKCATKISNLEKNSALWIFIIFILVVIGLNIAIVFIPKNKKELMNFKGAINDGLFVEGNINMITGYTTEKSQTIIDKVIDKYPEKKEEKMEEKVVDVQLNSNEENSNQVNFTFKKKRYAKSKINNEIEDKEGSKHDDNIDNVQNPPKKGFKWANNESKKLSVSTERKNVKVNETGNIDQADIEKAKDYITSKSLLKTFIQNYLSLSIFSVIRHSALTPLSLRINFVLFNLLGIFGFNALLYTEKLVENRIYSSNRNSLLYPLCSETSKILLSILAQALTCIILRGIVLILFEEKEKLKNEINNNEQVIEEKIRELNKKLFIRRLISSIVILLLLIFFAFISIVFCGIYVNSQRSWIFGSLWSWLIEVILLEPAYSGIVSLLEYKITEGKNISRIIYYLKRFMCF